MHEINFFMIDTFTESPFGGAATPVCLVSEWPDPAWMLRIANEFGASDTAFVLEANSEIHVRTMTPGGEVGSSVRTLLASVHAVRETGSMSRRTNVRLLAKDRDVASRIDGEWIVMDLAAEAANPCPAPPNLEAAIGVKPAYVGKNQLDYLVELESENALRRLQPNIELLHQVDCRGVIVTSPSETPAYDFMSRFFAPRAGLPEDSVTASAHCCLAPFWSRKTGRTSFLAYQASRRGGTVRLNLHEDRVDLAGKAVTVVRGRTIV